MSFLLPYFNIPYIFYVKEKSFEETSDHVKSIYKILDKPFDEIFNKKVTEKLKANHLKFL